MPGVRQFERPLDKDRQGIGARIAGVFHSGPPLAEVIQRIEAENAAQTPEAVPTLNGARSEREKQARQNLVDSLNATGIDFSKSVAAAFRPNGPYHEFPAASRVIWTSHIDLSFSQNGNRLEVDGQKHATKIAGSVHLIDKQPRDVHALTLAFDENGAIEDVELSGDEIEVGKAITQYASATDYVQSFSVFAEREADQVTIEYADGNAPLGPPLPDRHYAHTWGMGASSHRV